MRALTAPLEITFWMERSSTVLRKPIIVGEWVKHYDHVRPHSALGYRPPAPQVQIPKIIQTQPMLLQ